MARQARLSEHPAAPGWSRGLSAAAGSGLAARRGWAQRRAARRAPFPAGCAERAWRLERLLCPGPWPRRLQEASLGPDTLGEGRGRERAKSQAPQPRRPAARPETGAVPGEGSSGRWAPGGGQRGISAVLPGPGDQSAGPEPRLGEEGGAVRRLSDLPGLGLVPLDLRLVSPQAEMDPEVGRIATFRITETREDGFELGVSRYITLGHRFSAFLVTRESAEPHGAEQRS